MKYLLKFNEGLFLREDDGEVSLEILSKLSELQDMDIEEDEDSLIIKNLKLDEYPGTYNITMDAKGVKLGELKIEYYKDGILKYYKILKSGNNITKKIYNIVRSKININS